MRNFLPIAQRLHYENYVADAHLDLAGEILLRHQAGESGVIRKYYLDNFRQAGIDLIFSAIYVDGSVLPEAGLKNALAQIAALNHDLTYIADDVMLVKTRSDLERAKKQGKIAIILYAEGLDFINTDLFLLDILYDLGVRGASLTWSRRNMLASGCCRAVEKKDIPGGLSEHGFAALKKLAQLSCFVDVSHLNDDGFADVLATTDKPFIATHSNARAIYDSYRNLTDEQIISIGQRGGLIGINACSLITGSCIDGYHLESLVRHIEHITKLIGSHRVCYGFDLCNSYTLAEPRLNPKPTLYDCFESHREMPLLTAMLLERGMEENEAIGIIGRNLREFIADYLPCSYL
ncbi:MAG: dipeptidase [Lachnospiraceae bacterium]|nr:dipeptidase [Lachnospiraceae bacterium]